MSRLGGITAIDISRGRVVVASGSVASGRVDLKSWAVMVPPDGLDTDDADGVGAWLRGALKERGIPTGRLVVSLPRDEAVLKEFVVSGAASLPPAELHEMVRLQMARHTTISGDQTEIDYLPPASGTDSVVAGAVARPRVEWRRVLARALGGKLARVELRAAGAQAVAVAAGALDDQAVIVVAPGPGDCEVLVVDRSRLGLARGVDLARPGAFDDRAAYAKRIAVETSRTLVSFRVGAHASALESVVVLGRDAMSEAVADACAEQTGLPAVCCGVPRDVVRGGDELAESEAAEIMPALGLLVRAALELPALDFANPKAAPDVGARWRQLVMAAVLLLIVLGGAGYLFAENTKSNLDARIAPLEEQEAKLRERYAAFVMTEARLRHFEAWREPRFDWLGHLAAIEEGLPDPPVTLIDTLVFASDAELGFVPGGRLDDAASWTMQQSARLRVGGAARSAEPGQAFREWMLEHPAYGVRSLGPEVAGRFDLELTTRVVSPLAERSDAGAVPGEPSAEGAP